LKDFDLQTFLLEKKPKFWDLKLKYSQNGINERGELQTFLKMPI
jgi:hypothetical protein